eukprot:COSAG06_NODE_5985_length_3167_cov_2.473924_2_plen_650_part_00
MAEDTPDDGELQLLAAELCRSVTSWILRQRSSDAPFFADKAALSEEHQAAMAQADGKKQRKALTRVFDRRRLEMEDQMRAVAGGSLLSLGKELQSLHADLEPRLRAYEAACRRVREQLAALPLVQRQERCRVFYDGTADDTYSNFKPFRFALGGLGFLKGEQFFHVAKALLCKDLATAQTMMLTTGGPALRSLGREVENYKENGQAWENVDSGWLLLVCLIIKLAQLQPEHASGNAALCTELAQERALYIAEGAKDDARCGIGIHASERGLMERVEQFGRNQLGHATMAVAIASASSRRRASEMADAGRALIRTRSAEERRRSAAARHAASQAEAEHRALAAELSAVQRELRLAQLGQPEPEPERPQQPEQPPFREIRAVFDSDTIRVYQAYNDAIADAAVAANSFRAPLDAGIWSAERMTWVKPSAVWMAYRCGWTTKKDRNQARVLALDLDLEQFKALMETASVVVDGLPKGEQKKHAVIVQWDPERVMDSTADPKQVMTRGTSDVRSIQIGMRGRSVAMLLDPTFVRRITDVTQQFQEAGAALEAGDQEQAARALWGEKREQPWPVEPKLRAMLQMDVEPACGDVRGPWTWQRGGKMTRQQLRTEAAAAARPEAEAAAAASSWTASEKEKVTDVDMGGFDMGGEDY